MKLPIKLKDRPLSYSSMKHFRKSPKHYIKYITGDREPPKPQMILGKAFELRLFSHVYKKPEMFNDGIYSYTSKPSQSSNAGKEEWANMITAAGNKIMVTKEQLVIVEAMLVNTLSCDEMMQYVNSIKKDQIRLTWTDRKTGIPFIGYADAEGDAFSEDWCFEIKTAGDGDPEQFVKAFYQWDYHQQIATYAEGYHKAKYRFPNFAVLVFETTEPFNCTPMMVESKTLQDAKDEWRASVDAFKFCMDEGLFHQGYEFRLQTMPYFTLRKVGYYKPKFIVDE